MSYESMEFRKYHTKSEFDKAINTLEGILKGISIDNIINPDEINELSNWCLLHEIFIDKSPFNELIPIIKSALNDNYLSEDEKEDILWVCNNLKHKNKYYDVITSDIQILQGLLHGILADNTISEKEVVELKIWLSDNKQLANTYPYDEVYSLIVEVLKDGKLEPHESDILKVFFNEFIDNSKSYNINQNEINELKEKIHIGGICSMRPEINIPDSMFCFTGASSIGTRSEIAEKIIALGGLFHNNVIKNVKYLIVGNEGNPCWAFSCYGRKVEKAMELRKSGKEILIVHENDFWDAVENNKKCS